MRRNPRVLVSHPKSGTFSCKAVAADWRQPPHLTLILQARYIRGVNAVPGGWETWRWDESLFAGTAGYYEQGRLPYAPGLADAFARSLALDGHGRLLHAEADPADARRRRDGLQQGAAHSPAREAGRNIPSPAPSTTATGTSSTSRAGPAAAMTASAATARTRTASVASITVCRRPTRRP